MDINPEYIEVAEDILNLLNAKKRGVIAHMCETEAHNAKVDAMIEAYVKADLELDLTLTKRSKASDEYALADLNTLYNFVLHIFEFNPAPQYTAAVNYPALARTILRDLRLELKASRDRLDTENKNYTRAFTRYEVEKDHEESEWGTNSQKEPAPMNPRYRRDVDRWENAILLTTEVFISRGIPRV